MLADRDCRAVGGALFRAGVLQADGALEEDVPAQTSLYISKHRLNDIERRVSDFSEICVDPAALTVSSMGTATDDFDSSSEADLHPLQSTPAEKHQPLDNFGSDHGVVAPRQPQRRSSFENGQCMQPQRRRSFENGECLSRFHASTSLNGGQERPSLDRGRADPAMEPRQPMRQTTVDDVSSHSSNSVSLNSVSLNRRSFFKDCTDRKQSRRDIWRSYKKGLSAITEDCDTPPNTLAKDDCTNDDDCLSFVPQDHIINNDCISFASSITMSEAPLSFLDKGFCSTNNSLCEPSSVTDASYDLTPVNLSERMRTSCQPMFGQPNKRLSHESNLRESINSAEAPGQPPHRQFSLKKLIPSDTRGSMIAPCQPQRQTSSKSLLGSETNNSMAKSPRRRQAPRRPHRRMSIQKPCPMA